MQNYNNTNTSVMRVRCCTLCADKQGATTNNARELDMYY